MTGTVTIAGVTTKTTGTFKFASMYRNSKGQTFFKFHRTESAAAKGSWDSPAMKKAWALVGSAKIDF